MTRSSSAAHRGQTVIEMAHAAQGIKWQQGVACRHAAAATSSTEEICLHWWRWRLKSSTWHALAAKHDDTSAKAASTYDKGTLFVRREQHRGRLRQLRAADVCAELCSRRISYLVRVQNVHLKPAPYTIRPSSVLAHPRLLFNSHINRSTLATRTHALYGSHCQSVVDVSRRGVVSGRVNQHAHNGERRLPLSPPCLGRAAGPGGETYRRWHTALAAEEQRERDSDAEPLHPLVCMATWSAALLNSSVLLVSYVCTV